MIQFNLLPDVKIEYIKARRIKRAFLLVSIVVSITSVVFMTSLFIGTRVYDRHIANLTADVEQGIAEIESYSETNKILTVQNQLRSLTGLHDSKPVVSRLFPYVEQITPSGAIVDSLNVDYALNTITLSGSAPTIDIVNKYVDTLKFTMYALDEDAENQVNAFSSVVLNSFSVSAEKTTYQIGATFDPEIFNVSNTVSLLVPDIISTRSETEKPNPFESTDIEQGGE